MPRWKAAAAAFAVALAMAGGASAQAAPRHLEGAIADGAKWAADIPANWNGTVILVSHGYSAQLRPPELSMRGGAREWMLSNGYALVGSAFSKPGWALEEAVPDQLATLDAFAATAGAPKRVIAWGGSMGGLVTVALVERHPERFVAAVPQCGSIAGALGMMNMALDGAFAFKTLLAPGSDIQLVNITDDGANSARVRQALDAAKASPQGRARLALAGTLAQLPAWSTPRAPEPAADDYDAQLDQMAAVFAGGVFFPRVDQERRAGGAFSWNTGVDYRRQLERSGRRAFVEALYRKAGLDLDRDLAALNAAPRVAADPKAVAYMRANYVPTGDLKRPMFSFHEIGDGATMVTKQGTYADMAAKAGTSDLFAAGWVHRVGHCGFTGAEMAAALLTVEDRLRTGRWDAGPAALNARAAQSGLGPSDFVAFKPAPFLRPCSGREKACAGEPRKAR
jgi:pimeloyl-ACP methyl ester carboxylesterase